MRRNNILREIIKTQLEIIFRLTIGNPQPHDDPTNNMPFIVAMLQLLKANNESKEKKSSPDKDINEKPKEETKSEPKP